MFLISCTVAHDYCIQRVRKHHLHGTTTQIRQFIYNIMHGYNRIKLCMCILVQIIIETKENT